MNPLFDFVLQYPVSLGSVVAALILFLVYLSVKRRIDFQRSVDMVFLKILIPKKESEADEKKETTHDFKEQASLMEQLLAALKSLYVVSPRAYIFGQDYLSLEYVAIDREIGFYVVVPRRARVLIEKNITSFYPDAVIEEAAERNIFEKRRHVMATSLRLSKKYFIPLKTYQKLESDSINNITNAMSKLDEKETSVIQILLRPTSDTWQERAKRYEKRMSGSGFSWSLNPFVWIMAVLNFVLVRQEDDKKGDKGDAHSDAEFIKDKAKKSGYEVNIRVLVTGDDELLVQNQLTNIIGSLSQFSGPGFNTLKKNIFTNHSVVIRHYIFRYFARIFERRMILSIEEIASLFHFPSIKYNKTPEIQWQNFKIVKAPVNIPKEGLLLGYNAYRGVTQEIRVKQEDRFRHFYVIGQTGTGKTSILQVMARQDLLNGYGLAVMDPHGDLANDLFPFVPKERADDVIYFNPADMERPLGINILEAEGDDQKQFVAQQALNIMIKLFGNEIFGPRLQDYFRNGALTLMDYPGGCAITDVIRLFTDDMFQQERLKNLKNPVVKAWWEGTYKKQGDREKGEMVPFWSAKFGGFITNTMMRNIVGQTKSSFNVSECMQKNKILLINLSKGTLGDFNSELLGLVMVMKIQMAAMQRQDIPKEERRDFFLYIDEFQNYITPSIESILSEARKYRLGLVVAHQYLSQLQKNDALKKENTDLKAAIFGNVGSMMSYKVGPEDAEFLEKQFGPTFSGHDLVNMDKFKAVAKISVDTQPTKPFSLTPVNPYLEKGDAKLASAIKELSRLKYGRMREFIEKEINFRVGVM